jgi:C1A family cysteine protease
VDLRATFKQWGLPIKDQGSRDTCAVFTFTGALEYALAKGTGDTGTRLSEEYLNWAANKVSDDDEDGASYEDLISAFDKWGICESSLMPYLSRYGSPEPTRDALNNAMQIWQLGFKRHWIARRTENGLDDSKLVEMKKVLASGWPLCAYSRDHSILLVGYQLDDKMPGGGQFITRNSATQRYETIYFEASKTEFGSVLWIDLPRRKSDGQA